MGPVTSDVASHQRPFVRILGPLSVELGGRAAPLGGRLRRALLADFALHANEVISMDRLVEDMWGDHPPIDPVNTIQVYIGQLRRLLEPGRARRAAARILVSLPPGYQLTVDENGLDALAFEAAVGVGRTALAAGDLTGAAGTLRTALALWRGDALPEFADAAFARVELARLREMRLAALEDRIDADLALGSRGELVSELEALTASEPFRERLWELRLLALYRADRQADALRAYQDAHRILGEQLGIEPGPKLQQLGRRIATRDTRLEQPRSPRRATAARGPAQPAEEFVGRRAELAQLEGLLDRTAAGQRSVALVVGEAGTGKSRLVAEVAARAWTRGFVVAAGRCFDGESAPPFAPLVECLSELAQAVDPQELRRHAERPAAVVSRLLPELHQILGELDEAPPLPPEEDRARLFDAVARLVVAATRQAPVLLVIDDLQWADPSTMALAAYLIRASHDASLLVVACYRPDDIHPGSAIDRGLAALQREVAATHVVLPPLTDEEASALLRNVLGPDADTAAVSNLLVRGHGHPFFLRELASDARAGVLDDRNVPTAARELVARRVHRLPEPCKRLVAAASVFDGPFDIGVAATAAGMSDDEALDALDQLILGGLMVPAADGDTCEFVHDIARQSLYQTLTSPRRARLHRAVATAMEQRWPDDRQREAAAALAHHYAHSTALGGMDRGALHAERAAATAEGAHAYDDVVRLLELALALSPDGDSVPRWLARLGRARIATGEHDNGVAALRQAAQAIASAEGREVAARLLAEVAHFAGSVGGWQAAGDLAAAGQSYLDDRDNTTWAWLKLAQIVARGIDDPNWPGLIIGTPDELRVSTALRKLPAGERPSSSPILLAFKSRGDVLATAPGDPESLTFWAGEYTRALELVSPLAAEAEEVGRIEVAIVHRSTEARCLNALGRFEEADVAFRRGTSLVRRLAGPSVFATHLMSVDEERWAAVGDGWGRFRVDLRDVIDPRWLQWYSVTNRTATARVMANMGATGEAVAHLEAALSAIDAAPPWTENYLRIIYAAAEVHWLAARTDHAEVIERNARDKLLERDFRYPMTDLRLALARLAAVQGRLDEAAEWFGMARVVLDEQGALPLRVIVDHDESVVEARMGHSGAADTLLARARKEAVALGMHGWARNWAAVAQPP